MKEEHHETDAVTAPARELRYLRRVAELVLKHHDDGLYFIPDELHTLAQKALNVGKLSRAEIIKKARKQAAITRTAVVDARHEFLMNEIKIISKNWGRK